MNIWAILAATIIAFIVSAIYYIILAKQREKVSPSGKEKPSPKQALLEILRTLVLTSILAYVAGLSSVDNSLLLAVLLWLAFPVVLLAGSVMYEKAPVKLAVIHAGDWFIKLIIITRILDTWK